MPPLSQTFTLYGKHTSAAQRCQLIDIKIDDREIKTALARMRRAAVDMRPAFRDIGEELLLSVKRNFEEEGRPEKWKKSRRADNEGGQTLSDKATLRNSFTYRASGTRLVLGTAVAYAAAHHFGLDKAVSVPSHRRLVKKAYGKTLKFPVWAHVKAHSFNPKIPARPFLMIQENDKASILGILRRHLGDAP